MKYIRFISMLLIGIVLVNLVGCDFASSAGRKYDDLYRMVKCHIPTPDFGRVGIEIVEEDDYGRILFRYSDTDTRFTGEKSDNPTAVYGYFICQKRTKTDVYYFDTVCYMLGEDWDSFTEDILDDFKHLNEWNQEIISKDIIRANPKFTGRYPTNAEIEAITGLSLAENNENGYFKSDEYVNCDSRGRSLFFVHIYSVEYVDSYPSYTYLYSYILISTPSSPSFSGEFLADNAIKVERFQNHRKELIEVKEKAGWEPINLDYRPDYTSKTVETNDPADE